MTPEKKKDDAESAPQIDLDYFCASGSSQRANFKKLSKDMFYHCRGLTSKKETLVTHQPKRQIDVYVHVTT